MTDPARHPDRNAGSAGGAPSTNRVRPAVLPPGVTSQSNPTRRPSRVARRPAKGEPGTAESPPNGLTASPWAGSATVWLVVTGTLAAVVSVIAEGRLGPRDPRATDPTSWWGILPPAPPTGTTRGTLSGLSALGVVTLCLCWILLVGLALTGRLRSRLAVAAVLAWGAPFALGPPLFSRDAYAYAAQGELARRGIDPATHGVAALAGDPSGTAFLTAVDPRWRDTHTPYGGGAVAVERFAAGVAHLLGAGPTAVLVTLRILAVIAVAVLVVCTARLAAGITAAAPAAADRPARRDAVSGSAGRGAAAGEAGGPRSPAAAMGSSIGGDTAAGGAGGPRGRAAAVTIAVAIVGANPVTVIHLVGGLHLDALVAAALTAALLLERHRAASRRGVLGGVISWSALGATALASFAGTVKATAFLGLLWLVIAHARAARAAGRAATAAVVAVDLAIALAVLVLSMLGSGFGPTWLEALATSGALTTGIAPASLLAALVAAVARLGGAHLATGSGSALLTGTRGLCLALAGLICAYLLRLAWRRPGAPDLSDETRAVAPVRTDRPDPSDLSDPARATAPVRTDRSARTSDRSPAWSRDGLLVLGIGGLAVALGSPVLYPWYLAPPLPMLGVLIAGWHLAHQSASAPNVPAPNVPAPNASIPNAPDSDAAAFALVLDPPAQDLPATSAPALEAPASDVPAPDGPVQDIPASGVPASGAPVQDVPAPDVPVQDIPAQDVPAGVGSAVAAGRRRCRSAVAVVVLGSIWLCGATLSPLGPTWRLLAPDGADGTLPLVVAAVVVTALLTLGATITTHALRSDPPQAPPGPWARPSVEPEAPAATR